MCVHSTNLRHFPVSCRDPSSSPLPLSPRTPLFQSDSLQHAVLLTLVIKQNALVAPFSPQRTDPRERNLQNISQCAHGDVSAALADWIYPPVVAV